MDPRPDPFPGQTDLAMDESTGTLPHGGDDEPSQEEFLFGNRHDLLKSIFVLDKFGRRLSNSKLVPIEDPPHYYVQLEPCVGRILCVYEGRLGSLIRTMGTGFKVGKTTVLTARHVVAKFLSKAGYAYSLKKVYFTTSRDATLHTHVALDKYAEDPSLFRLTEVEIDLDPTPMKTPLVKSWTPNDFAFLALEDETRKDAFLAIPHAFPRHHRPTEEAPCFVVGYPGYIKREKFILDYKDAKDLYDEILEAFGGFQKKSLSVGVQREMAKSFNGTELVNFDLDFFSHSCPTMRGTSGAPLSFDIELGTAHGFFDAIHVGGDVNMGQNFAISTRSRHFFEAYSAVMQKWEDDILQSPPVQDYLKSFAH